jgi:hypothetical protein
VRRLPRAELILPLTILLAAVMVGISQFMVLFELTPPGGEPLAEQLASDQHGWALLLLAVFSLISTGVAVFRGVRVAAYAAAAFGVAALLLFLLIDLPDAGKLGDLEDRVFGLASVRTEPQLGFWLEAVGVVVLALATGALATLSPEQLRATPVWLSSDQRDPSAPGRRRRRPAAEPFDFEAVDRAEAKQSERRNRLKRPRGGKKSQPSEP